mgnify:FL=1
MSEKLDMTLAHHHTALCVSNWEISSAFYERLGFRVENDWYWPDGVKNHKSLLCFCKKPDCWLELFEYPEGKGALTERFTKSAGCVYQFALETFLPGDVDRLYQFALSAGGSACQEPGDLHLEGGGNKDADVRKAVVCGPDREHIVFLCPIDGEKEGTTGDSPLDGVKGFHHNALRIADPERSVCFYRGLGFKVAGVYKAEDGNATQTLMRLPNGNGLLLRSDGKPGLPSDVERMRAAGSMFQYCFWVDRAEGIDTVYQFCLDHGASERIKPFWHEAYGLSHWEDKPAFVYGPDDEILEFLYIDYKNS